MPTLILVAGAAPPVATAMEAVPESAGWRGFLVVGGGYTDLKSNLVAGNNLLDIGHESIVSVNQPARSDDAVHPIATGEVNYTFGDRWQAFLGTSLEDAVTLDGVAQFGLRKDFGANGAVQGGFLFSGVPTQVWEDPYAEGVAREETDRDSTGLRLQWDRILGSAFEATFSWRDIAIDTERSGEGVVSVACDADCQGLLKRDGDYYAWDLSYLFKLGAGRNHLLRPMVRYTIDDRKGDAISGDGYRLQLSYVYTTADYTLASNAAFGSRNFDERNPIHGVTTDSDRVALDATLFYRLPTSSGRWQAVGSVLWAEDDSDVDFHDTELFNLNLGVMYRFGAR
jgi:hypothetical protein